MSRSLGAIWLTTVSPIRSSPSVMSSSPAIIRRAVDLPQPEGPTRITNSPSATSRLMFLTASKPSEKRLLTPLRTISAIPSPPLSLDCARGQSGNDAPLEEQHKDDDGDRHDHCGRGDVAGRGGELRCPGEQGQGGGGRL